MATTSSSGWGPPGWPKTEVPNESVANAALQYMDATVFLFNNLDTAAPKYLLPIYTLGGLALELYLKSMSSSWVYEREFHDPATGSTGLIVTAEPSKFGHKLVPLFNELHPTVRAELEQAYAATPVVQGASTIQEAISVFDGAFENSRYIFEKNKILPSGSINDFVNFVQFLGAFVAQLPKRPQSWYPRP